MLKDDDRTGRQTRNELWIGIVVFVALFMLGNLLTEKKLPYTSGLLLGGGVAVGMVGHMYGSIERALLYEEETAKKKIRFGSILRMVVMAVALATAVLLPEYLSVLGVFFGIISLKFSAYVQPLTHKVFLKFIFKGR